MKSVLENQNHKFSGFTPPIYNVWKQQNKSNKVNHFGNSEPQWLENLVYFYTRPGDVDWMKDFAENLQSKKSAKWTEYAGRVGKARQLVERYRDAARVAEKVQHELQVLHDKTAHLAAIHALPESCWQKLSIYVYHQPVNASQL